MNINLDSEELSSPLKVKRAAKRKLCTTKCSFCKKSDGKNYKIHQRLVLNSSERVSANDNHVVDIVTQKF